MSNAIPNDTEFAKYMTDVMNAKARAEYMYGLLKTQIKTKSMLKGHIQRLTFIANDFTHRLTPELLNQLRGDVLNEEDTMQVDAVMSMFMCLPKEIRDKYEASIEEDLKIINQVK